MSNSMSDDYFSFMSDRGNCKHSTPRRSAVGSTPQAVRQSDTVEFIEEPQIEVTESSISDTMIQRMFRKPA